MKIQTHTFANMCIVQVSSSGCHVHGCFLTGYDAAQPKCAKEPPKAQRNPVNYYTPGSDNNYTWDCLIYHLVLTEHHIA